MGNNEDGEKLTTIILENLGFEKEIIRNLDGDENKMWIKEGITIYEDSWWIKDGKSCYEEGETEPEITFAFAVYVKGDGSFKGGFIISTDTQLKNLFYSLTNINL